MIKYLCVFILVHSSFASEVITPKYEFSFGTAQLFVDDLKRKEYQDKDKIVLPTTSALFIGEYFINKKWGLISAFNLPLATQKFLIKDSVNGDELIEEVASSSLILGSWYSIADFALNVNSLVQVEPGILLSTIFDSEIIYTPSATTRLKLVTQNGFSMYIGALASYGLKGYVLFYGVGHQF
jgi:hypothetical protein